MKFQYSGLLFTVLLAVSGCGASSAPDSASVGSPSGQASTKSVVVDGSSTVFRISKAAQIAFAESNPDIDVVVESHGTGGGFGRYFQGEVDIIDASREAKPEESSKATGEFTWSRYLVAHDGITVVVNPKNDFVNELSVADLKKLWEPDSKIKTWKDLNPAWPDRKISLYSPDKDSGTFEYFTEAINKKARAQRDDIQASPDDNTLVRGVTGDVDAIGYFGFAYYSANASKLKAVKVKGEKGESVMPSKESILSGSYSPLSRPLYIYVKNAAAARPEVSSFVKYYLNNISTLAEKAGYVSPTETELKLNAETLAGGGNSATKSASEPKKEAK